MTELEALNLLLRAIGSNVVNNLNTLHPDAENAKTTLNRIRRSFQKRSWWFNIDYEKKYTPDANKEIIIASEVSSIVPVTPNIVIRGNKLYDTERNTTQFESDVVIYREIRKLQWDDMPESAREYCAYLAAAEFVRDEIEDPVKEGSFRESAGLAMVNVKKEDLENAQYNMFNQPRVQRGRLGVQPYSRGKARFYGTPDR